MSKYSVCYIIFTTLFGYNIDLYLSLIPLDPSNNIIKSLSHAYQPALSLVVNVRVHQVLHLLRRWSCQTCFLTHRFSRIPLQKERYLSFFLLKESFFSGTWYTGKDSRSHRSCVPHKNDVYNVYLPSMALKEVWSNIVFFSLRFLTKLFLTAALLSIYSVYLYALQRGLKQ